MKNYFVFLGTLVFSISALGSNGITPNCSSAKKHQVGTTYDSKSLVWFTSANGILTETYYPTIDSAQLKDSQIIVTDGSSFFVEEKGMTTHKTVVNHPSLTTHVN